MSKQYLLVALGVICVLVGLWSLFPLVLLGAIILITAVLVNKPSYTKSSKKKSVNKKR